MVKLDPKVHVNEKATAVVGEVAKFLYWRQHQEIVTQAKPQVGKATWDWFCTKMKSIWKRNILCFGLWCCDAARTWVKTLEARFSEPGICVTGRADCFDACMSTLTQDERMPDVLCCVVWAGEVLKAELCIKSELNSLCAERFSLPLTNAHTDQHSCTNTHSPLCFSHWMCCEGCHALRGSGGEVLVQMNCPGWLLRLEAFNRSPLRWKTTLSNGGNYGNVIHRWDPDEAKRK